MEVARLELLLVQSAHTHTQDMPNLCNIVSIGNLMLTDVTCFMSISLHVSLFLSLVSQV